MNSRKEYRAEVSRPINDRKESRQVRLEARRRDMETRARSWGESVLRVGAL